MIGRSGGWLYTAAMSDSIYLDHNATTPMLPAAADAVREASLRFGANPGSQHEPGRRARRALEDAREQIGKLLGARLEGPHPDRVIFTSGGTEANNLALFGLLNECGKRSDFSGNLGLEAVPRCEESPSAGSHLVTSKIEHPSVLEPAEQIRRNGCRVACVGVDENGVVRLSEIEEALGPETRLVSVMLGNNETGVLQPVRKAAKLCGERNVPLHTDAAQVVGKLPVDFAQLGVSLLSCAAHKFGGPLGIGALVVGGDVRLRPIGFGGHQQGDLRPGTDTLALAVGMCTALEHCDRESDLRVKKLASLRDRLEREILSAMPSAMVIGAGAERLPNTANIAFVGLNRQALVMALDLEGVACSTGSACSSGSSELSAAHVAMGLDEKAAEGSVRFSLGATTKESEIEEAVRRILFCCQRLRQSGNR